MSLFLDIFSRLEVHSVCERTFHNTGLYFFHLENYDADRANDDITSSFCLVKVTQTDRYIVKKLCLEAACYYTAALQFIKLI